MRYTLTTDDGQLVKTFEASTINDAVGLTYTVFDSEEHKLLKLCRNGRSIVTLVK